MSLSKTTQSWKRYYYILFVIFLAGVGSWVALAAYEFYLQRQLEVVKTDISEKERQLSDLLAEPKFKQYIKVQELVATNPHIPWSDYVKKILEILDTIKAVEGERGGVELSDFQVDLTKLSLNGVVSNLRVLYGKNGSGGLIDAFNQLDFLSNIAIRNYERSEENSRSYQFTLSANVINHATTGATHQ